MRGTVISLHAHGATVRLEDGTLAAVAAADVAAGRPVLAAALASRRPLEFAVDRERRHAVATLADRPAAGPSDGGDAVGAPTAARPVRDEPDPPEDGYALTDPDFERRIADYLKSTEAWAPADRPEPAVRHLVRKRRRTAFFEARTKPT